MDMGMDMGMDMDTDMNMVWSRWRSRGALRRPRGGAPWRSRGGHALTEMQSSEVAFGPW